MKIFDEIYEVPPTDKRFRYLIINNKGFLHLFGFKDIKPP